MINTNDLENIVVAYLQTLVDANNEPLFDNVWRQGLSNEPTYERFEEWDPQCKYALVKIPKDVASILTQSIASHVTINFTVELTIGSQGAGDESEREFVLDAKTIVMKALHTKQMKLYGNTTITFTVQGSEEDQIAANHWTWKVIANGRSTITFQNDGLFEG